MMPCTHCGEAFERHEERDGVRWCRDKTQRFNVEFQPTSEVIAFLKENPDKSSKELAELWIERMTKRKL